MTEMLNPTEEAFDEVARTVRCPPVAVFGLAARMRRNRRFGLSRPIYLTHESEE